MRKVLGYTMAYDREATVDSRKTYIEFFIKNLTAELKAAPPFSGKGKARQRCSQCFQSKGRTLGRGEFPTARGIDPLCS
jgi:hypothetical protein